MLNYSLSVGHDPVKSLMEQVVKQCISDYSLGKMNRGDVYDWLDDTASICFIADCLRGFSIDDVAIREPDDLYSYVEREIDKIDKRNADIETLSI